jgi:hypothetical protein
MSADESSQEPTENTTAPFPKGRIADEFDVGSEFSKGPPPSRSSSWADLDISIIVGCCNRTARELGHRE